MCKFEILNKKVGFCIDMHISVTFLRSLRVSVTFIQELSRIELKLSLSSEAFPGVFY